MLSGERVRESVGVMLAVDVCEDVMLIVGVRVRVIVLLGVMLLVGVMVLLGVIVDEPVTVCEDVPDGDVVEETLRVVLGEILGVVVPDWEMETVAVIEAVVVLLKVAPNDMEGDGVEDTLGVVVVVPLMVEVPLAVNVAEALELTLVLGVTVGVAEFEIGVASVIEKSTQERTATAAKRAPIF